MKVEKVAPKAPAVEPKIAPSEAPVKKPTVTREAPPPEKLSVTTGDKWVRPSEVSRDRLRTTERHTEKTELEKAREAFAVADGTDPEQRMLRASELRELMVSPPPAPATRAAPEPRAATPSEPPRAAPPSRVTRPTEPVPAVPIPRIQSVNSVEPSVPPMLKPTPGSPSEEPQMARWTEQPSEEAMPSAARGPPSLIMPIAPAPPARKAPSAVRTSPSVAPQLPVLSPSKYPDDSRVREIESDISHFRKQCQDLETELERTRSRLDEEVERYGTVAESKRIRAETLEEDARRAKNEWSEADKEYRRVKSKRDKEVSDAQKRIDDQAKRIKNAEAAREKRIREIDKEKQA